MGGRYILLELIKNALRATVEAPAGTGVAPPSVVVEVRAVGGAARVSVRDQGRGIDPTAAASALGRLGELGGLGGPGGVDSPGGPGCLWDRLDDQVSYMPARSPLHGIGVGLALSRLHARYLGGTLTVGGAAASAGGSGGTEAVLELPLRGAREVIPLGP